MEENWSFGLLFALVGLFILFFSLWRWKQLYANLFIDDNVVVHRKRYKTYGIWGFILFMAGIGCIFESNMFVIIVVGMAFGYSRAFFEPYFNASVVNNLTEICLYLRPFIVDDQNAWTNRNGYVKGFLRIPESIEKYLCQEMNEQISQTFAIGNPNSCLPSTFSTTNLYANENEWKKTVAALTKKAQVIVVRIGDTEGCLWEIAHCTENSMLNKTIFLIDDMGKLDLIRKELEQYCPIDKSVLKDINTNFALFIDEQSMHWTAISLCTRADIKILISAYLDSHKKLFAKLKRQKEENGVFKNATQSASTPIKRWQIVSLIINPIAYCLFNKWPKRWMITLLSYSVIAFILSFMISFSIAENEYDEEIQEGVFIMVYVIFWCLLMIPWIWVAPRVSWRCRNWGSKLLFTNSNKSLALWLLAFSICIIAISTLQIYVE